MPAIAWLPTWNRMTAKMALRIPLRRSTQSSRTTAWSRKLTVNTIQAIPTAIQKGNFMPAIVASSAVPSTSLISHTRSPSIRRAR